MLKLPLINPVLAGEGGGAGDAGPPNANLKLPDVADIIERDELLSITKSSDEVPFPKMVIVLVPLCPRIMLTLALLTNFISAHEILAKASMVNADPPKFVPSIMRTSVVPVFEVRNEPVPFNTVFQFDNILIESPLFPTQ